MKIREFVHVLVQNNLSFFSGVPCSTLPDFIETLEMEKVVTILAANEGNAVGYGIGYYLATKKIAVTFFQNSGFSNAINPIASVLDKCVYDIPMVFIIGYRGYKSDEPQHELQGKITEELLRMLNIEYYIVSPEKTTLKRVI